MDASTHGHSTRSNATTNMLSPPSAFLSRLRNRALDRVAPKLPRRVLAIAKMVRAPCGAAGFLLHVWPVERGSEQRHFLSTCAVRGIAISASIPTRTTTSIF